MVYISNNNQEIIDKILLKIKNKSNVRSNVFNKVYGEDGKFNGNSLFPTLTSTIDNSNADNNEFNREINLPINILGEAMDSFSNSDEQYSTYENQADENIFLSRYKFDVNNLYLYNDIAKTNTNTDMLDLQASLHTVIGTQDDYKDFLKTVAGNDFEYLVQYAMNGSNLKNLLKYKFVKDASDLSQKSIDDKIISDILSRKRIFKQNYKYLKNIYSLYNKNQSLYDVFSLDDKKLLYVENMNVVDRKIENDDKKEIMPKVDIMVSFFQLNDKFESLAESYKNRIVYKDTLNISIKMSKFIGYHTIKLKVHNSKDIDAVKNKLIRYINSTVSSNSISSSMGNKCIFNLVSYMNKNNINIDIRNLKEIRIVVSHNTYDKLQSSQKKSGKNYYIYNDGGKLGDYDNSKDKLDLIKFIYGNFNLNPEGNVNAKFHVKNKVDLSSINTVLPYLEDISLHNKLLIDDIKDLNILFGYEFADMIMYDILKKKITINSKNIDNYYIYDKTIDVEKNINNYIFKTKDDADKFKKEIYDLILKKFSDKLTNVLKNNYLNDNIFTKENINIKINIFIDNISKDISNKISDFNKNKKNTSKTNNDKNKKTTYKVVLKK